MEQRETLNQKLRKAGWKTENYFRFFILIYPFPHFIKSIFYVTKKLIISAIQLQRYENKCYLIFSLFKKQFHSSSKKIEIEFQTKFCRHYLLPFISPLQPFLINLQFPRLSKSTLNIKFALCSFIPIKMKARRTLNCYSKNWM